MNGERMNDPQDINQLEEYLITVKKLKIELSRFLKPLEEKYIGLRKEELHIIKVLKRASTLVEDNNEE